MVGITRSKVIDLPIFQVVIFQFATKISRPDKSLSQPHGLIIKASRYVRNPLMVSSKAPPIHGVPPVPTTGPPDAGSMSTISSAMETWPWISGHIRAFFFAISIEVAENRSPASQSHHWMTWGTSFPSRLGDDWGCIPLRNTVLSPVTYGICPLNPTDIRDYMDCMEVY